MKQIACKLCGATFFCDNGRWSTTCDAVQCGIEVELQILGEAQAGCSPKQLRVGLNSAMVSQTAIVRLLIEKGIITEGEWIQTLTEEANREVERYEEALLKATGKVIKLH